jgi:hypothetical protein
VGKRTHAEACSRRFLGAVLLDRWPHTMIQKIYLTSSIPVNYCNQLRNNGKLEQRFPPKISG